MPAWTKDDKVVCFFQSASSSRPAMPRSASATKAKLDDGNMWPNAFALKKLTKADEKRILALVKQAVS